MSNTADSFLCTPRVLFSQFHIATKAVPFVFFYPDCTDLGYIVSTMSFCAVCQDSNGILCYKCKTATYPLSRPIKVLN